MLVDSADFHTVLQPLHILLVDDHPLFRAGLAQTIHSLADRIHIFEASDLPTALAMCASTPFDLIVLDLYLPDLLGLDGLMSLRRIHPTYPVVLISGYASIDLVRMGRAKGAQGFIYKGATPTEIRAALRRVLDGELYFNRTTESTETPHLSPRQIELLEGLVLGWPNKQIARAMGTSENTVRTQLARIFRVLHVSTRTEAAHVARLRGIV